MILEEIAGYTKERVKAAKSAVPLADVKAMAKSMNVENGDAFYNALKGDDISFICEVKKASPSKGIIAEDFPYLDIAKEYERAGASAISVLTEPKYFKGDNNYLKDIVNEVSIPVLRKDFTVDEYMIYEAKTLHASAILLICAILSDDQLCEYAGIARELGMDALVEAHDEEEVDRAIKSGARIIGVNNRNLKDFSVDVNNSVRLRSMVPDDIIYVSESGIKTPDDISILRNNKTDAVLIGETFMRHPDKSYALQWLKGGIN